jgi:hypothetical protein
VRCGSEGSLFFMRTHYGVDCRGDPFVLRFRDLVMWLGAYQVEKV